MAAASGSGETEWEICNDDGFVYKRRKKPSTVAAAAATAERLSSVSEQELTRQRRLLAKRSLLALRCKYEAEIRQWERLSSAVLDATLPPPVPDLSCIPYSSPPSLPNSHPRRHVEDMLAQVEAQECILDKLSEICDLVESLCDEREQDLAQSLIDLPIWGSPRSLMNSLSN